VTEQDSVAGSWKHTNETLGSIKGRECLGQSSNYQFLKNHAPCSWKFSVPESKNGGQSKDERICYILMLKE
jgi:hypothetical protein